MTWGSSPLTRGKRTDQSHFHDGCGLIPTHAGKTPGTRRRARQRRAQPHSRGENSNLRRNDFSAAGSSPLTRGKLIPVQGRFLVERLIPAHTGKTKSAQSQQSASWAHPRSRRENVTVLPQQSAQPGSSPLTQGKPREQGAPCVPEGLIPAHAGKTLLFVLRRMLTEAHPRSRGENFHDLRHTGLTIGSSPLTRGKHRDVVKAAAGLRLIPAHAGKTVSGRLR